ncbi:hypothetical protein JHK85_048676 [Glycine max]|nr:hypothetical protein JHK85_048676 [Glycine max]
MVEARELHALECGGKHGCDSRRWVHRRGVLLVRGSHWRDDNAVPGQGRSQPDIVTEAVQDKDSDEFSRDQTFGVLNSLKTGDPLHVVQTEPNQHHTQPPPRYSEASLVKKLEELGIGRPSTYASTIKVLQVSAFLSHHFSEVMDYGFTADMETELDNVSGGLTEWKGLLRDYWTRFKSYCERTSNVHIHQVEKMLEKKFGDYLFASLPDQSRTTTPKMLETMVGYGYIAKTLYGTEEEEDASQPNSRVEEPKLLGVTSGSYEKVLLKSGPYGVYVQLGEDRKGYIPKRASVSHVVVLVVAVERGGMIALPPGSSSNHTVLGERFALIPFIKDVDSITLKDALEVLQYPLTLPHHLVQIGNRPADILICYSFPATSSGNHPKDGQPVILKLARAGLCVRHRRTVASVPKNVKPSDVTLEKALEYLSGDDVRRSGRPKGKSKVQEVELAKLKGFPKVELQIDSQAAVMSIKGRNVGSSNGRRLITTIRKLMADFEGTRVVHIYQDVNMCTDALTNTAYDSEVDFVMFNQPPDLMRFLCSPQNRQVENWLHPAKG